MYVAISEPGGGDMKLLTIYLSSSGCVVVRSGYSLISSFLGLGNFIIFTRIFSVFWIEQSHANLLCRFLLSKVYSEVSLINLPLPYIFFIVDNGKLSSFLNSMVCTLAVCCSGMVKTICVLSCIRKRNDDLFCI